MRRTTHPQTPYRRPRSAMPARLGLHLSPALRRALEAAAQNEATSISAIARRAIAAAVQPGMQAGRQDGAR